MVKFRNLANEARKNWTPFDHMVHKRAAEVMEAREDAREEARQRRELIQALAKALMPAPKSRLILHIDEEGEILVDLPRLAAAILAAGYRKA